VRASVLELVGDHALRRVVLPLVVCRRADLGPWVSPTPAHEGTRAPRPVSLGIPPGIRTPTGHGGGRGYAEEIGVERLPVAT